MPIYKLARFEVRADAREDADRAMHELASYVRKELPGSSWTVYRDPNAPTHYTALTRADNPAADARHASAPGVQSCFATLQSLAVGPIEISECELVTSSDLAPRRRR